MRQERENVFRRSFPENSRFFFTITQMIGDMVIFGTLSVSVIIGQTLLREDYYRDLHTTLYTWATILTTAAFILSCARSGVYDPLPISSPPTPLKETARRLIEVLLLLTGAFFVLRIGDNFSRLWLLAWGTASLVALCGARLAARAAAQRLVRSGRMTRKLAIIGADEVARQLAAEVTGLGPGTRLVGLFADVPPSGPRVRAIAALEELASQGRIDEIIVASSAGDSIIELCRRFHPFSVALRILAPKGFDYFRVLESCRFGSINTFLVVGKPLNEAALILKWLEDKLIALLCLLIMLPLMLLIALAIKLDSPGPVFFRQQRLGANNRPFDLLKFRSMYRAACADPAVLQAQRNDPRVTRVGRFLRRTSLDELPQLINVLKGEMSLVGPRPHAVQHDAEFGKVIDGYFARNRVRPGITGWAQVHGLRGETDTLEKISRRVQYDLYYIGHWSLLLDLQILCKTFVVVFGHRNAY
jgi:Undecaprenyl-phosphate glucose phosphotransferase